MNRNINKDVENFLELISDKDKYYANYNEKALLRNYDACDDFVLTQDLIKDVWGFMKMKFSGLNRITFQTNPITILHTNAGTGKVLEACPSDNVFINAFNNDYTCKKISDLLNARTSVDFSYSSSISDISHYFILGDMKNTKKYDIVFTQPTKESYYKDIDNTSVSKYDSIEYYPVRSLDFLAKGGYLCIFTHHRKFNILKNNKELYSQAELVHEISNNERFDEYGCLIFKKK